MSAPPTPVFDLDLAELIRLYAERGLADWAKLDDSKKKGAEKLVGPGKIVSTIEEVDRILACKFDGTNAANYRFIPMPIVPSNRGIEAALFFPVCDASQPIEKVRFEVLVIVSTGNRYAMRYDPADGENSHHCYGHVQFTRHFLRGKLRPEELLDELSVRYPANPLGTSAPKGLFLLMAVAFHGFSHKASATLRDLLNELLAPVGKAPQALMLHREVSSLIKPGS